MFAHTRTVQFNWRDINSIDWLVDWLSDWLIDHVPIYVWKNMDVSYNRTVGAVQVDAICRNSLVIICSLNKDGRSPLWKGLDSKLYSHMLHLNGCSSPWKGLNSNLYRTFCTWMVARHCGKVSIRFLTRSRRTLMAARHCGKVSI